jgi:Tfp pilus assembly protein PilO
MQTVIQAGLTLESYQPEQEVLKKSYTKMGVHLALAGDFSSVVQFFTLLARGICLLRWRSCSLVKLDDWRIRCSGVIDIFLPIS